ncbi:MAG: PepSY-associated TM helix domain-containing protein [Bacteroidales bacterium]
MKQKKRFKFFWHPIHKWAGLIFGVILTIICFTGVILSFEQELLPLTIRSFYYYEQQNGSVLTLYDLTERLEQAHSRKIQTVTFPADTCRTSVVTFTDNPDEQVYINPQTAEIVGTFIYKGSFFSFVRELHRYLLLGKTGRLIVGTSTLVFVLILLSGLLLHLPRSLKKLPGLFMFSFKGNAYRKLFTLHFSFGLYALFFLLVMALTGPFWSFNWYRDGIYKLAGVDSSTPRTRHSEPKNIRLKELSPVDFSQIEEKVAVLGSVAQNLKEIRLTLPGIQDTTFTLALIPKVCLHPRQNDQFTYSLQDGTLQKESVFKTKSFRETFRMWIFAIHTGSWGGIWGKFFYALAALIGASLPLTGYLLWYKKYKLKRKQR